MITPSDNDYKETKQIMLRKKSMKPEFIKLAEWIDETYHVKTINIIYDTIDKGQRPRLEICFEFEKERLVFVGRSAVNLDVDKQKAIAGKFKEILLEDALNPDGFGTSTSRPYLTDNIWIIYGAFEPIARMESNENIPQSEIDKLKIELSNKDLWVISRAFAATTFFLFTDQQVKEYEHSEKRKEWTDKYFDLLDQYNEFNYFKRGSFSIYLDSKANFDTNYESNWYYYYK